MAKFIWVFAFFVAVCSSANVGRANPFTRRIPPDTCSQPTRRSPTSEKSIFESLTADEYTHITQFMMAQPELNLIDPNSEDRTLADNIIHFIEWDYPEKADVLNYLDENGAKPARVAKVSIYRGSHKDIVMYQVGPLPQPTWYRQVSFKRAISWNSRNPDSFEYGLLDPVIYKFFYQIRNIAYESFAGYTYSEDCELCLTYSDNAPRGMNNETRKTWIWFLIDDHDGTFLKHVGLNIRIDHYDMDPSNWFIDSVDYNGYHFKNAAELTTAYYGGSINKISLNPSIISGEAANKWASLYPRGDVPDGDEKSPPRMFEPEGHRWSIIGENTVKYLNWRFSFNIISTSGLHIFDARYAGQRVVYEFGIKEALSSYAGYDPVQTGSMYLDSSWGLGTSLYELIPGSDCPFNAEYFDYSYYKNGDIYTVKNTICIFEQDLAYPARRHYNSDFSGTFTFASSQAGTALVIRTTSPVYNYDYVLDYIFYPNGVVETKFALGGYLQAIYYSNNNNQEDPYSTRVHEYTMGSLHQHILNYKIDLDIGGTQNTFEIHKYEVGQVSNPFYDAPITMKKIVKELITEEEGLHYNFEHPHSYVVTNQNQKNRWGVPKGFKVFSHAPTYFLGGEDPRITGGSFAKYQVAITKQKDSENHVNSIYCQAVPTLCPQHLDDYLDGEDVNNTDIVLWVSIGAIHEPISEDVPTQELYGHTQSLFIRPFNYFDIDPAINLRGGTQFFRRDTNEDGSLDTQISLKEHEGCIQQQELPAFDGTYYA